MNCFYIFRAGFLPISDNIIYQSKLPFTMRNQRFNDKSETNKKSIYSIFFTHKYILINLLLFGIKKRKYKKKLTLLSWFECDLYHYMSNELLYFLSSQALILGLSQMEKVEESVLHYLQPQEDGQALNRRHCHWVVVVLKIFSWN